MFFRNLACPFLSLSLGIRRLSPTSSGVRKMRRKKIGLDWGQLFWEGRGIVFKKGYWKRLIDDYSNCTLFPAQNSLLIQGCVCIISHSSSSILVFCLISFLRPPSASWSVLVTLSLSLSQTLFLIEIIIDVLSGKSRSCFFLLSYDFPCSVALGNAPLR